MYRIVILRLTLLTLIVFLFYVLNSEKTRWNEDVEHLSVLKAGPENVDIAFIGGSRLTRAVNADHLYSELLTTHKLQTKIYDFSILFPGMDHNYLMAKSLLEKKHVKNLFVEFNFRADKEHPLFHLKANILELAEGSFINFRQNPIESTSNFINDYFKRISKRIELYIRGEIKSIKSKEEVLSKYGNYDITSALTHKKHSNFKKFEDKFKDLFFTKSYSNSLLKYNRMEYYIRKIIDVAKRNNTKLYFICIKGRYIGDFFDPEFLIDFENKYNVKIIQPTEDELIEWYENDYYADIAHLNPDGSNNFSHWFANYFIKNIY